MSTTVPETASNAEFADFKMDADEDDEESTPAIEKIEKTFLTCPVCFEVYSRPKCLPCLHTFCYHCLLSYIESKDMYGIRSEMGFPCPVCKQIVAIRNYYKPYKAWVDEIQNNFLIQNMIDCLVTKHKEETRNDTEADDVTTPPTPLQQRNDNVQSLRQMSSYGLLTAARLPVTSVALDKQASHLLRMYSSQYGLTQQWASSPGSIPYTYDRPDVTSNGENISAWLTASPLVTYSESNELRKTYETAARNWADYKPPKLADVICLPKHNGIIVLDYDNRCVKYVKNVFMGRNVTTAMEVIGRPCCVALLDKNSEDRIVVSLLNRNKLYFIRIPDLVLIDVMDTKRPYRGLAVLTPTTILAGSAEKTARVDLIRIDHRCKRLSSDTIYKTQRREGSAYFDLRQPHYIAAVSPRSFVVADTKSNSLVYLDIVEGTRKTKAVKRFILNPTGSRAFHQLGGVCYHGGSVYMVDKENHEVYKVILGQTVQCVTVLKPRDTKKPTSVCVGPKGEVCVVDWEGKVCIYKPSQ